MCAPNTVFCATKVQYYRDNHTTRNCSDDLRRWDVQTNLLESVRGGARPAILSRGRIWLMNSLCSSFRYRSPVYVLLLASSFPSSNTTEGPKKPTTHPYPECITYRQVGIDTFVFTTKTTGIKHLPWTF